MLSNESMLKCIYNDAGTTSSSKKKSTKNSSKSSSSTKCEGLYSRSFSSCLMLGKSSQKSALAIFLEQHYQTCCPLRQMAVREIALLRIFFWMLRKKGCVLIKSFEKIGAVLSLSWYFCCFSCWKVREICSKLFSCRCPVNFPLIFFFLMSGPLTLTGVKTLITDWITQTLVTLMVKLFMEAI